MLSITSAHDTADGAKEKGPGGSVRRPATTRPNGVVKVRASIQPQTGVRFHFDRYSVFCYFPAPSVFADETGIVPMNSGVKLAIGAAVVVGVTSYMAYVGAASSWKYYVTAEECLADQSKFVGSRVRVSGTIAPGSLQVAADRSRANFSLEGNDDLLAVVCTGLLPDNLDEEMEVVVEGRLEAGGLLRGDKLLTRCASKYESDQTGGTRAINSGKDKEGEA